MPQPKNCPRCGSKDVGQLDSIEADTDREYEQRGGRYYCVECAWVNKCLKHAEGKPCTQVIAEGSCIKEECVLFPKVLKMLPKLKHLHELEALGVQTTTIWDFSEKGIAQIEKRKRKAQKWLNELYPALLRNIPELSVNRR